MDFRISEAHQQLLRRSRRLAEDFAARTAEHDRLASHPWENYAALREEGFYGLNVPQELGGWGVGLLGYTLVAEALAQGCAATALSYNMHLSIVGPIMQSPEIPDRTRRRLARLVIEEQKLIAGNFSETSSTALLGAHTPETRATKVAGGYRINGRKAFASMLQAADYCAVLTHPEHASSPTAALLLLVPRHAEGRRVKEVWDTLGMRATRSDSLILEDCWVPDEAVLIETDDIAPFRRRAADWLWASYTAVYLGVGVAAYHEIIRVLQERQPRGYSQPLAYHPDVRRRVAEMSVDLEAARLMTYHSAWLSDTYGPTEETLSALFRAKYMVGEAVSRLTRTALTLGGAHAIFKTAPLERLFRDGALAPIQFPPPDHCLANISVHALGLDPHDIMPPLK